MSSRGQRERNFDDGRTKKAYEAQYPLGKWKCHSCIQAEKQRLAEDDETLSQNEMAKFCFDSKKKLEYHQGGHR